MRLERMSNFCVNTRETSASPAEARTAIERTVDKHRAGFNSRKKIISRYTLKRRSSIEFVGVARENSVSNLTTGTQSWRHGAVVTTATRYGAQAAWCYVTTHEGRHREV